ncbi:hypothetical protein V2J09_000806 [Rumex salicifolius]
MEGVAAQFEAYGGTTKEVAQSLDIAAHGSTHNFISDKLATELDLTTEGVPSFGVTIGNGEADEYLLQLPIKALPGIGNVMEEKLKKRQVQTCGQLQMISKECLQKDFGLKTGEMLWNYSRGIDNRLVGVIQENKSVGAEVNWGVRFRDAKDVFHHFISSLCKEVSLRLQGCGVLGCTFTLKIKKRRKDAGKPTKYMGCGDCENLSHSTTVPFAVDDVTVLQRIALQLFGQFRVDYEDIRGVGLQVGKLESADHSEQGRDKRSLRSWLASAAKHTNDQNECQNPAEGRDLEDKGLATSDSSNHEARNQVAALPSMNDLDFNVIQSLPPDIISEINDMYGGILINLINKKKEKTEDCSSSLHFNIVKEAAKGVRFIQEEASVSYGDQTSILQEIDLLEHPKNEDIQTAAAVITSLSQEDVPVLEQLPKELRVDKVIELSEHRKADESAEICEEFFQDHPYGELKEPDSLLHGSPPCWVPRFKSSKCLILNAMAEMYFRCGSSGLLSCILRSCMSQPQAILDVSDNEAEESTSNLRELLKQYFKLMLGTDMEEIYVCCRLLKRLSSKSKALQHIYSDVLYNLQLPGMKFQHYMLVNGSLEKNEIPPKPSALGIEVLKEDPMTMKECLVTREEESSLDNDHLQMKEPHMDDDETKVVEEQPSPKIGTIGEASDDPSSFSALRTRLPWGILTALTSRRHGRRCMVRQEAK